MSTLVPGVGRIAVVRANALGDFVFTLPALTALRRAYPDAAVTLIGRPLHHELLAGRPSPVDGVEVAPPYGGVTADEGDGQSGPDLDRFFSRMRRQRFDLALQLHGGGGSSNDFTRRLGARVTAGLRARGAPPLDRWARYTYLQNEVVRWLEAVALVGASPPGTLSPALTVTDADRTEAAAALGWRQRPFAVIVPGARDTRRRWPADRFAAVARRLARRGLDVVVTGDATEAALGAALAARAPGCTSLTGSLTLRGLVGVLARATIVVANDTGAIHVAAAVGTPTVGIYWCVNAINAGPIATDRHRIVASWRTHCPACGTDCMTSTCSHRPSFVAEVAVDAVLTEVDDLLSTVPGPAPVTPVAESA